MSHRENVDKKIIQEYFDRWVENVVPSREQLLKRIFEKPGLRIYIGVDPTGPHLHLGHATNFLLLRLLQRLGHHIIVLVGDFTARIGDPTDKMAERQPLTEKQVKENLVKFNEQASHIISFSGENRAETRFNSEWYENSEKMNLKKFMNLLGYFSVQNLLHRPGFRERIEKNRLGLQEFMYPLLQGYDGVALDVDVEVGGTDQTFNMSIGRALRKAHSEEGAVPKTRKGEKFFVTTKLLVNPKTGKKLMNKSEGGMINLDDALEEMFGKVMALDDASMFVVGELSSEMPTQHLKELRAAVARKEMNPRDAKLEIASAVVSTVYDDASIAEKEKEKFQRVFSKKETPKDVPALEMPRKVTTVLHLLISGALTTSKSEARRLILQGGVKIDGATKTNPNETLSLKGGEIIKIGKHRFFKIK